MAVHLGPGGESALTDLEILQMRANEITDDSLESTRRMVQLVEESQATGGKTLEMLDHQGEQLDGIEKGMDVMHNELNQASKHITGMEKWCGLCVCPWNRTQKVRDTDAVWGDKKSDVVNKQPRGQLRPDGAQGASGTSGPYIQRITNDAREDEMEENLVMVGANLTNLKNMAQDMGNVIERQNKQLDRMGDKAKNVDIRVKDANDRTQKLLNK